MSLRVRYATLASALLAFVVVSRARAQTPFPSDAGVHQRVDSLFAAWDKPNSPGCALGVFRNGELMYGRGYGMANLDDGIPITTMSVFNIGSMSKQFTAACIVLLSQQGKLTLDDDVRKYIPELPDYGKTITIRHLLNHTSGLRDYPNLLVLAGGQLEQVVTADDALDIVVRQKELNFNPGEEWMYSNTGYFLASLIVRRVSGMSLGMFARKNIFEPLGMKNTMILDDHTTIVPHRATGYSPRLRGGFQVNMSNWELTGDGGVQTSIEDLVLWDRNFVNPVVGGPELIAQLLTPGRLNNGEALHYALGIEVGSHRGLEMFGHEGIWAGYRSDYRRFPEQKLSVVCLCNLATMNPLSLTQQVADIYLAGQGKDGVQKDPGLTGAHETMTLTPGQLSLYAGHYRNPAAELMRTIILKNGKLMYVRGPASESELTPIAAGKFRMVGVPIETDVTFVTDESGKVSGMQVVSSDGSRVDFELCTPATPSREQLVEYTGTFRSDELGVNYAVALKDSQLIVKIGRSETNPMAPTVADIFTIEGFAVFRFTRNHTGAIDGFLLSQSKIRNLMFRKMDQTQNQ